MNIRSTFVFIPSLLLAMGVAAHAADDSAKAKAAKITYDENVRPILREHCFSCHNQDQSKGGLALDSYGKLMEGGSSGEVVFEEDLDSSRLWSLVSHEEEPNMPPNQDKLADAKLEIIRKWIETGLLENAGSKAGAKKKTLNLAVQATTGKPSGPVAMPENLSTEPVVYTPRAAAVSAIASSPWGPLAAVAGQQQIVLYNSDSAELVGVLPFPEGIAYSLRFSRDGALLLAGGGRGASEGCAALYDVKTGQRLVRVGDELDVVLAADISNDHTQIALGGPRKVVRIYSTESGQLLHEIRKHTDWIYAVRFSPDGVLLATADRSNGLFVWEADTAREYLNLRGHTGAVTDVAWRPDSNVLASASLDGTVRLWEMNDGKQIKRWNGHGGGVNAIAYTHDGRLATAGQDRTAKLWDPNGKLLKTFPAFGEPALRVTFTHDGKRVVAGDWAGLVKMWNAADAKEVASLPPNPPTLAMRIQQIDQQLASADAAAGKAEAALKTAQANATAVAGRNQAAIDAANKLAQQKTQILSKLETDLAAATKGATESDAAVKKAVQALAAAQKALDLAQQTHARAVEKKKSLSVALAPAKAAAQKAATDAKALPAKLAPNLQNTAKDVAAKKAAADTTRAAAAKLQAQLQKLRDQKAAAAKAAAQTKTASQ